MLVIQLKKTDYNTKINEIEKKTTDHNRGEYITQEFHKLTAEKSLLQDQLKQIQ